MKEKISRREFLEWVVRGVTAGLVAGTLGSHVKAAPPPPLWSSEPLPSPTPWPPIEIEKPKPVEIPRLGEIITVSGFSEGEGGRKIKEKRAIHSCESEEGIWGVAWHQLVARHVKTEEGEWYENFSQVCFTTVKEGETQPEAQILREWLVPEEKVEQTQEIFQRVYHDLRLDKGIYRDSASGKVIELDGPEVGTASELGIGWSASPVVVPYKKGFRVYYWASRSELSEMPRIYCQDILPEGRLANPLIEVGNSQAWRKLYPSALVDEQGNHYVFWEQDYEKQPGAFEIWAQRYDSEGKESGDSIPVSLEPYSQHPKAVLAGDKILVVWEYPYIDESNRAQIELRGQYLAKNGELIGGPFPVLQDGKDQNGLHDLAVNSQGEVVVVRAASDGKVWGRLIGKNGEMNPIQQLAAEEGMLMVGADAASFGEGRFLVSGHKFRPWESLLSQAFGVVVEVRSSARRVLDEEQGVIEIGGPVRFFGEKRLVVSSPFLLSPEIGQQFTSVSGGRDSAFFAWEDGYDRTRNPDGSQVLGRFATLPLDR